MGAPAPANEETGCLPIHKLLTAVALVVCVGGILIGSGEGGNPCYLKKEGGASYPSHCARGPETDTCCKSVDCVDCVQVNMPILTLAGIAIMCGECRVDCFSYPTHPCSPLPLTPVWPLSLLCMQLRSSCCC